MTWWWISRIRDTVVVIRGRSFPSSFLALYRRGSRLKYKPSTIDRSSPPEFCAHSETYRDRPTMPHFPWTWSSSCTRRLRLKSRKHRPRREEYFPPQNFTARHSPFILLEDDFAVCYTRPLQIRSQFHRFHGNSSSITPSLFLRELPFGCGSHVTLQSNGSAQRY